MNCRTLRVGLLGIAISGLVLGACHSSPEAQRDRGAAGPVETETTQARPAVPAAVAPSPGVGLVAATGRAGARPGGSNSGAVLGQTAEAPSTESYAATPENPFRSSLVAPLSTFSIDVDTASYSNVRRLLTQGQLPPRGAVRVEEMINYFTYDYDAPLGPDPVAVSTEVTTCPWAPRHRLVRIGLRARDIDAQDRPPVNLTFLLDVSGSMGTPNKLPLLKRGLKMLVDELRPEDRVAIAVYAGAAGLVLPSTSCANTTLILNALDDLRAGGSTNGGAGIKLAYDVSRENFVEGGINRVILCTDGDFNVGVSSRSSLHDLIQQKARSGVFLTVLGFGMGNYKDDTLELLADKGNGSYGYIDTIREARRMLVEQIGSTLMTVAKDVKIQVEMNPAAIQAYRLIGYENRLLAAEDFNDDKKDAGEIGAGHRVTVLYEVVPHGVEIDLPEVDLLKYQGAPEPTIVDLNELMTLKLRYKEPSSETSKLLSRPILDRNAGYDQASEDTRFGAAVALFGMLLGRSEHTLEVGYPLVLELAEEAVGPDPGGYRRELLDLVRRAQELDSQS